MASMTVFARGRGENPYSKSGMKTVLHRNTASVAESSTPERDRATREPPSIRTPSKRRQPPGAADQAPLPRGKLW